MTECPSHVPLWLQAVAFGISLVTVWSSYLIRVKSRRGWVISFWNQVPFAVSNVLHGALPYLIINACFAWNAFRALRTWSEEKK